MLSRPCGAPAALLHASSPGSPARILRLSPVVLGLVVLCLAAPGLWMPTGAAAQTGIADARPVTGKAGIGPDSVSPIATEEFRGRREALAEAVGHGLVLAVGSAAPAFDYLPFVQNAEFRYLTGFTETDAALLLEVEDGRVARELLFVNDRDPAVETWEGYRIGPEGAPAATGIEGRSVAELGGALTEAVRRSGAEEVLVSGGWAPEAPVLGDVTQRVQGLLQGMPDLGVRSLTGVTNRLRETKSDAELDLLRMAVAMTSAAHLEVMSLVRPGLAEFEVQALVEHTFRRYGAEGPAFESIVGSGPNATILHYNSNDRFMEDGDLLLVDMGASYRGYAADITRTVPVNGRFGEAQREVYQLVLDAQRAAEEMAGPGVPVAALDSEIVRVLEEGLVALGLVESVGATWEDASGALVPQVRLWYMHGLGHGIGLNVHDPWPEVLGPGTAFTIEPGIYVRPNLFTEVIPDTPRNRELREAVGEAFERHAGIGVRIEDDYIVTDDGLEWISPVPREIEDIEAFMAEGRTVPLPRRDDWVEWFRGMPGGGR